MSLKIQHITDNVQTYTIPAAGSDDTFVEVTIPDFDCQPQVDLQALEDKTKKQNVQIFHTEGIRLVLKHYNPNEEDAINQLVTRQLMEIGNDWVKSDKSGLLSGGDTGEADSSKSSDSSKKKKN